MARKLLGVAALLAGSLAALALFRRTTTRHRDRVDLYFEDGSMASLADGSTEAATLLPLAREALRAARGA